MPKYYDPEFCKCSKEITETNRPQKYGVEEHVVEGVNTISYTIIACNKCLNMMPSVMSEKKDSDWIEVDDLIIFEKDKDPGTEKLRLLGHLEKIDTIEIKHDVALNEIYQVVFGKGTSTFISESTKTTLKDEIQYTEQQFKIAGLTSKGRPIIAIVTPRDCGNTKRVITAWQLSRSDAELKKLLKDCPHLKDRLEEFYSKEKK